MDTYPIIIQGEVTVLVPGSPNYLSTYVLLEQEDWFEKEIRFIRKMLARGMHVIDVGASLGVYTLTMAKAIGVEGTVVAFEPTKSTADMLEISIGLNKLDNVKLVRSALSATVGVLTLNKNKNGELNSLSAKNAENEFEQVNVSTLDEEALKFNRNIDFIKIDAEGEELRIIEGGRSFLSDQSPLVMFEVLDGTERRSAEDLEEAFGKLGYNIYRLIYRLVGPAEVLVPVEAKDDAVNSEYNLFACKRDRAEKLERWGLLVTKPDTDFVLTNFENAGRIFFIRFNMLSHLARLNGMSILTGKSLMPMPLGEAGSLNRAYVTRA